MAFTELSLKKIRGNVFKDIQDEWILIAAGSEEAYDTMTASGGSMGTLLGQDVSSVWVRHPR